MFDRMKYPPWGVQGGKEGKAGQITVVKKSGETEIIYKSKGYPLQPGDQIIVETGGGGGYGPPSERSRELHRARFAARLCLDCFCSEGLRGHDRRLSRMPNCGTTVVGAGERFAPKLGSMRIHL